MMSRLACNRQPCGFMSALCKINRSAPLLVTACQQSSSIKSPKVSTQTCCKEAVFVSTEHVSNSVLAVQMPHLP